MQAGKSLERRCSGRICSGTGHLLERRDGRVRRAKLCRRHLQLLLCRRLRRRAVFVAVIGFRVEMCSSSDAGSYLRLIDLIWGGVEGLGWRVQG